ncbi:CBO0543 family protein [Paenibacillus sp. GCM10023248]|uniref:CBO0543 family protein n=1 Tax=Bacillales TaxID=1385 RepID=UPI002379CE71|nr:MULTISPECIES: CBO0543 family protein [Bacillales]MDD9270539.1 hypothetical protein [Paenibacillus sp. MAHUQ-63]MDR6884096.1 hypothetical protein [Bacillus sp. 3255]
MRKKDIIELIDANVNQVQTLIRERVHIWHEYVLFSDLWWFGVFLSIVPWVIWFFLRNKYSSDRILYVGFFVIVISLLLDILGDQLGFWHYRFNVIPVLPTYFPWDVTLMPVSIMFLIQVKPNTSPYLKALFFALLTSYVAEPFITWLKIYEPTIWRYSYSFPIQFIIYLFAHYISRRNKFEKLTS